MAAIAIHSDAKQKAEPREKPPTRSTTLFYEDLVAGQRWQSPARQITLEDVSSFSSLTGDFDPLHAAGFSDENADNDNDAGSASPFGRPIAHGLLGLSVLAGLSTEYPRVATLALVGITDWQFENPIFFGETVYVVTEVETIATHGRRAGRITWLRKLISSDGRLLQQGRFITLVASNKRSGTSNVPAKPR